MAMGFGIWSMHYIGMLAFRLPVPVRYDWAHGPAFAAGRKFLRLPWLCLR